MKTLVSYFSETPLERTPLYDAKLHLVLQTLQIERTYKEIFDVLDSYCRGVSGLSYGRDITSVVSRLVKLGLVIRTNPGAPKNDGRKHHITDRGREVLNKWNDGFDSLGRISLA